MWKSSPKIFFLLVSFVINQSVVNAATLKCHYQTGAGFQGIDESIYFCSVIDNDIFAGDRVSIDAVEGEHTDGHTNHDVQGILSEFASFKFFPSNLENIFENLISISIKFSHLPEITQKDIKVFPKLKRINLSGNKITSIDKDLFKFNPELRTIYLIANPISHIDPNVFDNLDNLIILSLEENKCKNALGQADSRSDVSKLVERVKNGDCE